MQFNSCITCFKCQTEGQNSLNLEISNDINCNTITYDTKAPFNNNRVIHIIQLKKKLKTFKVASLFSYCSTSGTE